MEMTLNNGFYELGMDEMMFIEGGSFWRHLGYLGATTCCVMACVATGGWAGAAAGGAAVWYWYDATH